jgi:hypothetical protein
MLVDTVRFVGIILLILGVMCMPIGYGVSPKRDQSVFHNLADMNRSLCGVLRWVGAVSVCLRRHSSSRSDATMIRNPNPIAGSHGSTR